MRPPSPQATGDRATPHFVAVSELVVPEAGREALQAAFNDRLGAVDHWPGFRGLQVWADTADSCALTMVSWWDSQECFAAYMRSENHHRSHQRIPKGEHRPRPRRFRRYKVIAR
jgi:heme-degrading monooxygenase HmoA